MNFPPPVWAREAAEEALRSVEGNHYAPARGRVRLRKAIKEFYGTQFGKELDPDTEIVVTSGANEGMSLVLLSLLPGLSCRGSASRCLPAHHRLGVVDCLDLRLIPAVIL